MNIESNILGVITQAERLKETIPTAMQEALAPDLWLAESRDVATRTLLAIADPKERGFIIQFVATIMAAMFQGGLSLTMRSPFPELRNRILEAQAARGAFSPRDLGSSLFLGQVQEFEDLILQWVETTEDEGGKKRDARDAGKTDEEIAHLISYIMLAPNLGDKGLKARDALLPHIEAFLQQLQSQQMDPAIIDRWLRAVVASWRQMVRFRYPQLVREQLNLKRGELL